MQRPDPATLACINPDCQHDGHPGQGNLRIRKVYGKDGIRLLGCSGCHGEFSERRNTALFNTKVGDIVSEGQQAKPSRSLTTSTKGAVSEPLLD